ncbi:MAG: hypothetical protein U1E59_20880 [Amaricoccus sp.]
MRMNPRRLELVFQWLMILGIIALMQPWSHFLHRYSVTIILIGLVGFSVFTKVPSRPESE